MVFCLVNSPGSYGWRWRGASIAAAIVLLAARGLGTTVIEADGEMFARAWQTEDGLPQSMVVSVAQTPDNYLWVATHLGVFRFDGVRFQPFGAASDAGVPTSIVRVMLLDHKGRLWLAKDRGALVCVDQGRVTQVFTATNGLSLFQTRSMAADKEDNIWWSDSQGSVFCLRNGTVQRFGQEAGLNLHSSCWLASDAAGQIWVSQGGEVGVFQEGRFEARYTMKTPSVRIQTARTGGIWLCDGQQIYHGCEGESPKSFGRPLSIRAGADVTAICEDRQHRLWVGTFSQGLFYWDGDEWRSAPTSHRSILSLSEDNEGNLWVGTQGGGLNRLRSRALEVLGPRQGLPFDAVQSVCESADGAIWAVGQSGLLGRQVGEGWKLVSADAGWRWGQATCIAAGRDGTIYVGTRNHSVICYQNGRFDPVEPAKQLGEAFIRLLAVSSKGDLWIGPGLGRSFHRIRGGTLKTFELPPNADRLRAMVESRDGNLWVATSGGYLLCVQGDTVVDETPRLQVSPYPIRALHATDDGSVWIGYAGHGLGRFKDGQFTLLRAAAGLSEDYISQISSDDQGRLWLAGNRGIFYLSLADVDALGEGRLNRLRSVPFGQGEGWPNLQATFDFGPNAIRRRDGKILMPMLSGLAVVDNRNLVAEGRRPPPVVLEQVTVNGNVVAAYDMPLERLSASQTAPANLRDIQQLAELGPGVQQMEIEYTAFGYAAPESLEFRYRLGDPGSDWVQAVNRRVAHFDRLNPGDYSFRVQARTFDGEWNETGALLRFSVRPFFWQTWWFQTSTVAGVTVTVALVVVGIVRRRHRAQLERIEHLHAVERERARIAKDIHDELGSQLTGITILSDLAQSADSSPTETQADVRKIGNMARELTQLLAEIVWAVNPRNDSLESFVTYACNFAEEFLRPAGIRCFMEVPEALPARELTTEVRHNLFMVVKEAVNNVVKHSRATEVKIRVAMHEDHFDLTIQDNGCGFPMPAAESTDANHSRAARHTAGNGLENMRQRIEGIGAKFQLHSAPGEGTRITVRLPVAKKDY